MQFHTRKVRLFGALLALWLAVVGCNAFQPAATSDLTTDNHSIESEGAETARVEISMQAGEMDIRGGAGSLMEGEFRYNVEAWQPQVSYAVNGSQGELVVSQPDTRLVVTPQQVNQWDLLLNDDLALELDVSTGAGTGVLDLSSLNLTGLRVETGVGETEINLEGAWDHDLRATIKSGVGALKIHLPGEMGVQVTSQTGLGGVTASNLERDGDTYVNEAFGSSPYTLYLTVESGVGAIELLAP